MQNGGSNENRRHARTDSPPDAKRRLSIPWNGVSRLEIRLGLVPGFKWPAANYGSPDLQAGRIPQGEHAREGHFAHPRDLERAQLVHGPARNKGDSPTSTTLSRPSVESSSIRIFNFLLRPAWIKALSTTLQVPEPNSRISSGSSFSFSTSIFGRLSGLCACGSSPLHRFRLNHRHRLAC
jgi:hypothetical protein